jgi:hypothetical protein
MQLPSRNGTPVRKLHLHRVYGAELHHRPVPLVCRNRKPDRTPPAINIYAYSYSLGVVEDIKFQKAAGKCLTEDEKYAKPVPVNAR